MIGRAKFSRRWSWRSKASRWIRVIRWPIGRWGAHSTFARILPGPWKSSNDRYKSAPNFLTSAAFVANDDSATIDRVLAVMGKKYPNEWEKWGPRFRNGLSDGSRVMLRYRPSRDLSRAGNSP